MNMILKLTTLPELQHLDRARRRSAVLDWWIALWKSWPLFLADAAIGCFALQGFELLTRLITDVSWLQFVVRGLLFVPTFYLVCVVRNQAIFLPRRDVLRVILQNPDYATDGEHKDVGSGS